MLMRCLQLVVAGLLLSSAVPAVAQPDGADIRIRDGTIVATAADYEMDGTMWTAFTRLEDSTAYVYRSTDHGLSWDYRSALGAWHEPLNRIGFVVGEGESAFNYLFYLTNSNNGDLYVARRDPSSDSFWSFPISTGPDTIRDFAVCRDYAGSNCRLYAAATNHESGAGYKALRFFRSADYGRTWALTDSYAVQVFDPHLAAGAGSYIHFACHNGWQGGSVHVWTNSLYLDPNHWTYGLILTDSDDVADPVSAPAFTLPESAATVWCLWSQNYQNSGDWDVKYSYLAGSGSAWSAPQYLAGSTAADEGYPDLRNYTSLGNQYINASYISDDNVYRSVYRRYAHASTPDQWSDTLRINQGSAGTGSEIRPKLCYTPGGPFSGAGCVFVGAGLNNCWWNGPYPSGAADKPDAALSVVRLSAQPSIGSGPFHIHASSPALLNVHDRAGRQVRKLALDSDGAATWDGRDSGGRSLTGGVYFVRLVKDGELATEKLVLQR